MKIKKKTGLMLVATATVAAVGVAAVSFAAWNGNNDTLTAHATTGATLFGFTNDQSSADVDLGTLVPYDQPANTIQSGSTIVSYKLPEYTVNADYSISVTTDNSSTTMKFYVLVGAEQTAVPTGAPSTWTGWKEVTGTDTDATFSFPASTDTTVNDKYINLVMASEDNGDMGQTVNFTVTLG